MLISRWTNAVMCRVNVQNVLFRLQCRLSVACAIHWWHCQSMVRMVSFLLNTLAAFPRPWSVDACTHALVGFPTPHSRRGSDLDKTRSWTSLIVPGLWAVRGQPLPEQRSTLLVASVLLSTVWTPLNVQFLFQNILSIFCCSIELLLS